MALKRILLLLVLLAAPGTFMAPAVAADANAASEQAVRAALLFNFLKFTEWPTAQADHPTLRICLATSDPAQVDAMEALGDRQVRGKPLMVTSFSRETHCNVIYVDSSRRWKEMVDMRATSHALTIGGYPGFVAEGGMIEISLKESGPRFDINLAEAKHAGLRIYPQLLRLARRIVE